MNCTQKQQLVCFPKVRVYKPWFRHFNDHKDFRNEGTVHLFSLMALFSYREMIYGEGCEELELSRIGEIIGIAKAIDVVEADDSKLDISVESRVPPAHTIGKPRKALRIQVFLVIRSSFFARQIPLVFYSALDWEVTNQEKNSRDPPTESQSGKEMKR